MTMNAAPLMERELDQLAAAHRRHVAGTPATGDADLVDRVLGRLVIVLIRDAAALKPASGDVLHALGGALDRQKLSVGERWQLVNLLVSPLLADVGRTLGGRR